MPSTDKRKKTFDHRQVELANVTSDAIRNLLPPDSAPSRQRRLDGWNVPKPGHPAGIRLFVQAANKLLTDADWAALSNAAYRDMHESPAAFDVLAGLYWGLRGKKIGMLPSRNVAWLTLKLMAAVPARVRVFHPDAKFCPLRRLRNLQINGSQRKFRYPLSLPRGGRLEAALRDALESNIRKEGSEPVDWTGLCYGLDQLLD